MADGPPMTLSESAFEAPGSPIRLWTCVSGINDWGLVDAFGNSLGSFVGDGWLRPRSVRAMGTTFEVIKQRWPKWTLNRPVSGEVRNVYVSGESDWCLRLTGQHVARTDHAHLEFPDGRTHRLPVTGKRFSDAQLAVLDEHGRPYARIRQAREPCPFGARYESVVEPTRAVTAERILVVALVSSCLSTYFMRPPRGGM